MSVKDTLEMAIHMSNMSSNFKYAGYTAGGRTNAQSSVNRRRVGCLS